MEGAAETGALTAARILEELGVHAPPKLATLVSTKAVVPQPCYRSADAAPLGPLTRRRAALQRQAEFVRDLRARAR